MENQETFDVESLNFPEPTIETPGNEKEAPVVPVEVPAEKVEEKAVEPVAPVVEAPKDPVTPEVKISDPPSQYEGESEIQFNLRKQIYDAGQAKAQAETPEEKSTLAQHIKGLRKELAVNHKVSEPTAQETPIEANKSQLEIEEAQAKEALKKMGYLSKDEVEAMVQATIANQSKQGEHLTAAQEFYNSHKDIAANPAQKEVLEKFIVDKFNITPQSSKQDLLVAMDMAASYLFPKNDTRAVRAQASAEKRDLLNVSSNTQTVPTTSKADEKLQSGLKEAGLSAKDMGWE